MKKQPLSTFVAFTAAAVLITALTLVSVREKAVYATVEPVNADTYLEVAAQFAPVLYQSIGPTPRADYITNFDFDGHWRADTKWNNCENSKFPMRAYVYYSVLETETHYFVHYAMYHARDYKGGSVASGLLEMAKETFGRYTRKYDPTGLAGKVALSHENDMEGCLIVGEKHGQNPRSASVVAIETLAHDRFHKHSPKRNVAAKVDEDLTGVKMEGATHPWLFVEAKGHGIKIYTEGEVQEQRVTEHLVYRYTGKAEDPERIRGRHVGYTLIPIFNTLWPRAAITEKNETYAEFEDYGVLAITALDSVENKEKLVAKRFGKLGSAFIGRVEGVDKARPPWGWYDIADKSLRIGDWFFDPARAVKNHFQFDNKFSTTYVFHPYFDVFRK